MSLRSISACLLSIVLSTSAGFAQSEDLDAFEALGYDLRKAITDYFGYTATGSNYATRREVGLLMDDVMIARQTVPGMPDYHPFLNPALRSFTRSFFLQSLDEMIEAMDTATPTTSGVHVYYIQSSGVVVEAWFPAADGTLEPFRVGIDVSDDVVWLSEILSPFAVDHHEFNLRWASLAERVDVLLTSHIHPDHWSPRFIAEMLIRGKPVYGPSQFCAVIRNLAASSPTNPMGLDALAAIDFMLIQAESPLLAALAPGTHTLRPGVDVNIHLGSQALSATNVVENNVMFVNFDVTVDSMSANDGVTFVHFGDENGSALLPHVVDLVATGFVRDYVIVANYSNFEPLVGALLDYDVRLTTPTYQLAHFFAPDAQVGMRIPTEANVDPSSRLPLFWGEGILCPGDV